VRPERVNKWPNAWEKYNDDGDDDDVRTIVRKTLMNVNYLSIFSKIIQIQRGFERDIIINILLYILLQIYKSFPVKYSLLYLEFNQY
jgi:hypothetical protein